MALAYLGLFLVVPVVAVFAKALEQGVATARYQRSHGAGALRLPVITAAIAVPLNTLFVGSLWAIAKFDFPGKHILMTVIDLPFQRLTSDFGQSSCCSLARKACSGRGARRKIILPFRGSYWPPYLSPSPSSRVS